MLGQQHGWPVPEGGAQALTDALVTRLTARGGRVQCGARVDRVIVRDRRAVGVRVAGGDTVSAERAVLADVGAPSLYLDLVGPEHLPGRLIDDLRRFQYGAATFKVDWALSAPVPWLDPAVSGAGTIHVADSMEDMSRTTQQLIWGHVPDRPFLLVGQMTTADPSRSPAGTEALWAYTHLPQKVRDDAGADGITGTWDERESDALAARMEDRIERMAPGFKALVLGRHVFTPRSLEVADANLVGGDVQGGTGQLHQQLIFRPTPGLARSETPVKGLYLASASAHPGGGVHGACGANAAKAALAHDRLRRLFTFAR
jgi:phytoene dehydrogenase-like protein